MVVEHDGSLVLVAEPTRQAVPCPKCGELSRRQHSSYLRRPLDLPWRGHTVRLRVHSRRWFCDVPDCPREIFAERFDGVLARYARRTNDATELLTAFALQAGGEGGARLAHKAGVPISPDTLLRLLHTMIDPPFERLGAGCRRRGVAPWTRRSAIRHAAGRPRKASTDRPAGRSDRRSVRQLAAPASRCGDHRPRSRWCLR